MSGVDSEPAEDVVPVGQDAVGVDGPEAEERISTALLTVLRFAKFTTSRFLTAGNVSQVRTAGYILGLSFLIKIVRRKKDSGEYWSHNVDRIGSQDPSNKFCKGGNVLMSNGFVF